MAKMSKKMSKVMGLKNTWVHSAPRENNEKLQSTLLGQMKSLK
jgi:hypothetical protein